MQEVWAIQSVSVEETQKIGEAIGRECQGGEIVALVGDLGAGKTAFVQGLARGLEIPEDTAVSSPTFAIVAEYQGRRLLRHLDLYRLRDADDLEGIGWRDLFERQAVVAIEWADLFLKEIPTPCLEVRIEIGKGEERTMALRFHGPPFSWWAEFFGGLRHPDHPHPV